MLLIRSYKDISKFIMNIFITLQSKYQEMMLVLVVIKTSLRSLHANFGQ